jgi:hypothetical protein
LTLLGGCHPQVAHRQIDRDPLDAAEGDRPAPGPASSDAPLPSVDAPPPADLRPPPDAAVPADAAPLPDVARPPDAPPIDAPPPGDAAVPPALPVVVTSYFPNQGWFGDPTIAAQFRRGSTLITQTDSVTGPCAARDPAAQGRCLRVVYTPPPGFIPPPSGAFVGVFFLTTLALDHPETVPPTIRGDANWGLEPPLPMPPGAARISFSAASEGGPLSVVFKAGTDRDSFLVPDTPVALGPTWTSHTLPLTGASYPAGVYGAFAWVLLDTSKPTTFYLDSIVWQ